MAAKEGINHSNSEMSSVVEGKPESGHHEGEVTDMKIDQPHGERVLVTAEDVSPPPKPYLQLRKNG